MELKASELGLAQWGSGGGGLTTGEWCFSRLWHIARRGRLEVQLDVWALNLPGALTANLPEATPLFFPFHHILYQ